MRRTEKSLALSFFVNALRATLGLGPLYGSGSRSGPRLFAEEYPPEVLKVGRDRLHSGGGTVTRSEGASLSRTAR